MGIPHSHFLGGPLRWSDLDREKARAYRAWKAQRCTGCGTAAHEWDKRQGGDRKAYVADVTYCPGCSLLHEFGEQIDDSDRKRGAHVGLVPLDVFEAREAERDAEEERMRLRREGNRDE